MTDILKTIEAELPKGAINSANFVDYSINPAEIQYIYRVCTNDATTGITVNSANFNIVSSTFGTGSFLANIRSINFRTSIYSQSLINATPCATKLFQLLLLVGETGLEPAQIALIVPKTIVYTNSTTRP